MADDGEILEPGSDKIGLIGTSGLVPVGYYKDEKKSAETFREVNGTRYSFPGDYAKLEADGTITLLDNGSISSARYTGYKSYLNGVSYGNSTFVVMGNSGTILTSSDGVTNVLMGVTFR